MELGEKLRNARLDAGLTQKQLCEGLVTRNMLSLIENGSARPSMTTLTALAGRLGKSVSYFLEDTAVISANTQAMEELRVAFDAADLAGMIKGLKNYRKPDPVYDREAELIRQLCLLEQAKLGIHFGRWVYVKSVLEDCTGDTAYFSEDLKRRKLLLLGQVPGERVAHLLPSLDEELELRAREAMEAGNCKRAGALLDACEVQERPQWILLRGTVWLKTGKFEQAKNCLLKVRETYPEETAPLLETCFRELGDYKAAYEYACLQRK